MTTKLSMGEKQMMLDILNEDLRAISEEINKQFGALWKKTQLEIEHELGFDDTKVEIAKLEGQIKQAQKQINELQISLKEYAVVPSLENYSEAGVEPPEHNNGYVYSHNRTYIGHALATKMDLLIVKRLKEQMDPEHPLRMLEEIAKSAIRGLIMSGTYEEGRANYEAFYNLDFQRYGVKIPRRLAEIKAVAGKGILTAQLETSIQRIEDSSKLLPEGKKDG